ncbi:alkanesulfonate monooxygenase SsuD/methylene tetrahydromethanopterin reductase-like flavin-dependent oxidoreductase (luciferase family) [Micromonospora sp. Llam0]|uniref:LLM class flavin-dependent oxidoreductase n=1 Tax=Micromonospora sp. Llam0 TaxID=2485143 RepID=UPI000F478F86|nr:LLM class flavin-dependent oxidoreductase [Micromonospora sp. Llam0]ROO62591.1 alkanesulfonate monooxygenase SsuD/methylene tetrahydromethanopterin reductase-like flavin-dependent oxidoreductase (luciferase family) [Micromonospora sp. Llam0]
MANPKIGVALPVREMSMMKPSDAAGTVIELAKQVEELGFDSVWVGDSFVTRPRLEPLSLLGAIAMVTRNVTVGTAALTAVLREPKSLAHGITTLDQLADGRLVMGLGMGEPLPVNNESDAVTMSYTERITRVDEAITAFKKVWRGEKGDLQGRYYNLDELRQQGPPKTPGGPGIWLASNGKPKAIRRTGTMYDGWMPVHIDPEWYGRALGSIRETATSAGRNPDDVVPSLYINVNTNPDGASAEMALNEYTTRYYQLPVTTMSNYQNYFGGTDKELAARLGEYVDNGCRHIVLRLNTFTDYDRLLRSIGENVVPAIHSIEID